MYKNTTKFNGKPSRLKRAQSPCPNYIVCIFYIYLNPVYCNSFLTNPEYCNLLSLNLIENHNFCARRAEQGYQKTDLQGTSGPTDDVFWPGEPYLPRPYMSKISVPDARTSSRAVALQ